MAQRANTPMIGRVTESRWNELVRACREAVEAQTGMQFQIGDAALEIEPIQTGHRSSNELEPGVHETLERFAEEIGVEASTLQNYRRTAAAWPKKRRRKHVSFTVHAILSGLENRFEVIADPPVNADSGKREWTCEAARRRAGQQVLYPQQPQERLSRVRSLTSDDEVASTAAEDLVSRPEVVEHLVSNPATWNRLSKARQERDVEVAHQARERTPAIGAVEQVQLVTALLGHCATFVAAINRTVPQLHGQLGPGDREAVHESLERVRTAADWCQDAVDTGDTSLSDQIAEFLRGEQP